MVLEEPELDKADELSTSHDKALGYFALLLRSSLENVVLNTDMAHRDRVHTY